MRKYNVHVLGCGHSVALPLQFLAMHPLVGAITVESRTGPRVRAVVDDLAQSRSGSSSDIRVAPLRDVDPDIVIVAYGRTIRPGEERRALFTDNVEGLLRRFEDVNLHDPFVIVVTNPVDAITDVLRRHLSLPRGRIVGVGGDLDAARVRWALSPHPDEVLTLGEHSEAAVFLADGVPLDSIDVDRTARERVRASLGNQLTQLGAPTFCPGTAIISILDALLGGQERMVQVSSYQDGFGTSVTWPTRMTKEGGVPIPMNLTPDIAGEIVQIAARNRHLVDAALTERNRGATLERRAAPA